MRDTGIRSKIELSTRIIIYQEALHLPFVYLTIRHCKVDLSASQNSFGPHKTHFFYAMSIDTGTTSPETQGSHLRELDKAVMSARRVYKFEALPDSLQSESESLDNLAGVLWERFKQEGERRDLEEAISLYRQVLEHRPPQNPLRPNSLNNLLRVLLRRWCDYENNPRDLDEAILLSKQAIEIQSPTHPSLSESFNNLALVL
jgi:tetratricopeptide (TPR) repeat protein